MFGKRPIADLLRQPISVALLLTISFVMPAMAQGSRSNEAVAVRTLHRFVLAEKEYFSRHQGEYAVRIVIRDTHQGSLLDTEAARDILVSLRGSVESAPARPKGVHADDTLILYRGYYYRVLIRQGRNAPGGAKSYVLNGRMRAGFALLASPVEYGASGVNTFIVGHDDIVYQKDLGDKTPRAAAELTKFDPDPTWRRRDERPSANTTSPQHARWQVGTVMAVTTHQPANPNPLITSYEVSMKIGDTVFVMLCTPKYDSGTVLFESGHEFNVLVGDDTITYNDILGNAVRDPILKRTPASASSF